MQLTVGESYPRDEIHAHHGGNPRAGICPTRSGSVLVFSDPPSGVKFGYDSHDGVQGDVYRYTGEGRSGDQLPVRANKALLESSNILLFRRHDSRSWIYVGQVELAPEPFEIALAPDQNQQTRKVMVFRFVEKAADFGLLRN